MQVLEERLLNQEPDRRRLIRRCGLAALLLVVSVYADVIFCGASVSVANLVNVTGDPVPERVQLFPERPGRKPYHGYSDAGGAAYQSEPGIQFMTRSIWGGQSIYWNPYSATGSFGPETLVDIKTSPLSITVALLGGSDLAFHLVFLALNLIGVFCLLVLFAVELRLSMLAAIAGGVTYLLNGYHVANLASNVAQTWYYFPILILALVTFSKRPGAWSFLGITAATVLILSTTFLPTTLVILGGSLFVGFAAALAFGYAATAQWTSALPAAACNAGGQVCATGLALLVLAALYLPIVEALRYLNTGDYYAARVFYPTNLFNLISLFTPKHAFESYNAITQRASWLQGNVAFHQGIVGTLIASQAIRAWSPYQRILLIAIGGAFLLLLARVYGVPGVTAVFNAVPVVGNIGQQYVWASVAMFFTLLVPFGMHAMLRKGSRKAALACAAVTIAFALFYTSLIYRPDFTGFVYVLFAGVVLGAGSLLVLALPRAPPRGADATSVLGMLLVLLSWVELTAYVNHDRLSRTERFSDPPEFVRYLQTNIGLHRVASYGYLGIPPEYGSAYGVAQVGSMNFHILPRYEAFFNRLIIPNPADRWTTFATLVNAKDGGWLNLAAIDLAGARFLVMPARYDLLAQHARSSGWRRAYDNPHVAIFENPNPLPRAFVVHRLVEAARTPIDEGLSPRLVATSDDTRVLAAARALGIGPASATIDSSDGSVAVKRYDHTRVVIEAALGAPGVLVLTDAWHPNWSVRVDGEPALLGRVNESFRGVPLAAGRHIVEMSYAPRTLALGMPLSIVGLALVAAILLLRRRCDQWLSRFCGVAGTERPRRSFGADARAEDHAAGA